MTADEIEKNAERAQAEGAAAAERVPTSETWGFYTYGDASPAMGGGVGGFMWFASRQAMLAYMGRLLPFFAPGPAAADQSAVANEAAEVARRMEAGELEGSAGLAELNRVLRHFSQVGWMGRLADLSTGAGDWERGLRRAFRELDGDVPDEMGPISQEEREDFLEFVRNYGA